MIFTCNSKFYSDDSLCPNQGQVVTSFIITTSLGLETLYEINRHYGYRMVILMNHFSDGDMVDINVDNWTKIAKFL